MLSRILCEAFHLFCTVSSKKVCWGKIVLPFMDGMCILLHSGKPLRKNKVNGVSTWLMQPQYVRCWNMTVDGDKSYTDGEKSGKRRVEKDNQKSVYDPQAKRDASAIA